VSGPKSSTKVIRLTPAGSPDALAQDSTAGKFRRPMSESTISPVIGELSPATPASRTARPLPWGCVVFGVALVAGLAMAFVVFHIQSLVDSSIDPYHFGAMGKSVAEGHGFAGYGTLLRRRVPLYPLVIGGVYFVFGVHPQLIFVLHTLYFAGTCVLAFDIGRRVFNRRSGIIAGLLCALHPMLLRYIPSLHLEIQLAFLVTLLLWLMVTFYVRPTWQRGALIGVVAGAACLTKAVVLLYPLLFIVGIVLACRSARRRGDTRPTPWKPLIAIVVALGLTIAPWTVRNYRASGHFVPLTTGTSDAFLRGFIFTEKDYLTLEKPPYTDAENASNTYFSSLARAAGTEWEKDDYETDQILNKEAKRRLLHEPGAVARKTLLGLAAFWYELTSLPNSALALVLAVGAWFLALVGWRRARREHRPTWLLFLPVLYFNISLALLLALGRYSVPILPALLVVSAFGVDTLLDRRAVRHV
jgi:4-amino-4-deoxy-L-arabinose transferase-like glycosyltransferase